MWIYETQISFLFAFCFLSEKKNWTFCFSSSFWSLNEKHRNGNGLVVNTKQKVDRLKHVDVRYVFESNATVFRLVCVSVARNDSFHSFVLAFSVSVSLFERSVKCACNFQLQSVMPTVRNKGKVECWCNEQNLRSLYPSYVSNNISRTPTVFTTVLLIDEGILWLSVAHSIQVQ